MSYIFYDGDNIGDKFAGIYKSNDLAKLKLLSASIQDIHAEIERCVNAQEARLIESGGDEGLIECEADRAELVANTVIKQIWRSFGLECTVGIGDTPREAYLDCQQKKASR